MDREVVKELIQDECTAENIAGALALILKDTGKKERLKEDYNELKALLKQGGNASANAAKSIYNFLCSKV